MSIERLIIDSDEILEGNSESAGGLGCEALDDSLRPEVLAILAGGCCTKISGREVVDPSVVGGLLVSYLHKGAGKEGLVGIPPSEGGIYGASEA